MSGKHNNPNLAEANFADHLFVYTVDVEKHSSNALH